MKSRYIILTALLLSICLLPLRTAHAAESGFGGEISVTGLAAEVSGDEAKFDEYDDRGKGGAFSEIRLGYEGEKYYLKLDAENVFRDTEKYRFDAGMWGKFKFDLSYTELLHNITFDARTFLSGAGHDRLTGTLIANDNPANWHSFDYSTLRKRYGAGLKLDVLSPFFLNVEVQREEKSGIKIGGGEGNVELPEPVDYTTDTFSIEAGYNRKPVFASVSYHYSHFENDNQLLFSTINGTTRALTLPPDNHFERFGFKGSVMLPLHSRISANIGIGRARSDFDLVSSAGVSLGETFDGKVDSQNYDVVFTTNPVSFLDAKVFYKYYEDKNKSDEYNQGNANSLFYYKKESYGAEAGFRLPHHLKLIAKYAHLTTDFSEKIGGDVEDRVDVDKRKDDTYGIDVIWSGLDFLTLRAGYERMNRRTDRPSFAGADPVEPYTGRFDVSPFHRDTFKASADISPLENLDISVGYKYKKTDYHDTNLGLRDDERNEVYADASYLIGKIARVFGYFDYEKVEYMQFQRNYTAGNDDPSGVTNATNYNYTVQYDENNFDYGLGTEIYAVPKKLTVTLRYDYVMSNGNADFTYLFAGGLPAGATNSNIDMGNWDDYRKKSFSVRADYNLSKPLRLTAGYAYERFKYSDANYDDYRFLLPGYTGIGYSGAFRDKDYQSNLVFLGLTYKF